MNAAQLILPCPSWAEGQECGPLSFQQRSTCPPFPLPSPDGQTAAPMRCKQRLRSTRIGGTAAGRPGLGIKGSG